MKTEKPPAAKTAAHWVLLPFRIIFRVLIVLVFLVYVFVGASSTIDLYKRNIYRAQDINTLYAVIDAAPQSDKPGTVATWLKARPLAETDKLMEMIIPKSPALDYGTFFEIAQREQRLGRPEEALFWLQLSRYRLRYDTVRCGADPKAIKGFDAVLNFMKLPEAEAFLQAHPDMLKKSLQRVLDFDKKYPAHDDPTLVCKIISTELPVDEENWEGYHQFLRKKTEEFIKTPDKTKPPAEKK